MSVVIINCKGFLAFNKYSIQTSNNIRVISFSTSKNKKKYDEIADDMKNINYTTWVA